MAVFARIGMIKGVGLLGRNKWLGCGSKVSTPETPLQRLAFMTEGAITALCPKWTPSKTPIARCKGSFSSEGAGKSSILAGKFTGKSIVRGKALLEL